MNRTINWGIIGPGKIANRFASSFTSIPNARLWAVASRDLEKARAFAREHNVQNCYDSYDALANDPNIDVVYIATPHAYHREQTLLCLHNKKAVLCEKPLTLNHNDATEMIEAAKKNNVFLMEALWSKFLPPYIKAKELIDNGEIGKQLQIL
jgi:predicted dehydrogenase